ncbi:DsbA family protein [Acuticoccus sp.]|uniref:DsbA family protein n=1 Tax=Acuticoccus sp. TaxID=1904378 RepID=UPI003B5253FA
MVRIFLAAAAISALLPLGAPNAAEPLTRSDVEAIVRDYLIANPEVLEEAFAALQQRRIEEAEEERAAALATMREDLEGSPYGAVLGNPEGDVTLVEFFDYNCGYCKRAHEDLDRLIAGDPNLRVVLREFPVLGEASMRAAQVSIAVNAVAPEAYDEFHRRLLATEGRADDAAALTLIDALGLPREEIEAAMTSDAVRESVEESYALARALQIEGTPSYVIGDAVEQGAVGHDALKARINIARCGTPSC